MQNKTTGFMTYSRETATERPPKTRVNDWQEMYIPLPEVKIKAQGARCMDCGVPFCHTGQVINHMTSGCPLHNLIPEWNDLIFRGLWQEAYERLDKTNNFPEFTGRTCPAPCEAACVLGINEDPVTIKSIENTIIDRAFEAGWVKPVHPRKRTGKKVAVIGSGPAGLAAADQLNKVGHSVTVFERADRPGGLMMYGIPPMKIEKDVVLRRIKLLEASGVKFVCNAEIGVNVAASDLQKEFDAVILCGGATRPREIRAKNNHLKGIHYAMNFLTQATKSLLDSNLEDGNFIPAQDQDVIVIGGGDTATDCIGTALRLGCKSLVQFDYHHRLPEERPADNPWPQWPKVYRLDYGQKEAKALQGEDPRAFQILTKEFIGDEKGQVTGVRTVQISWEINRDGIKGVYEIPGSEKVWPAQLVLVAIGFAGAENPLLNAFGVERDEYGNAKAEFEQYVTNVPGVFTAGDMRRGQSLVVWAIREGRGAARECDRYLMGETDLP